MNSTAHTGQVLWLTGLPASGKTTLAEAFVEKYKSSYNFKILDGDQLRKNSPLLGFTKNDRLKQAQNAAALAANYERQGYFVIVGLVSPYAESRMAARLLCKKYFEIYIATPLAVCISRDPKGLYKKALLNEIANFTGISDPYEAPTSADLVLDTSSETLDISLFKIYQLISDS